MKTTSRVRKRTRRMKEIQKQKQNCCHHLTREMGGGSTQVTFQVVTDEISRMADTDTFTFKNMAGQRYTLYAHSYLGYGLDHAQAKLRSLTTGDQDPCYPVGYMRKSVEDSSQLVKGSGNAELCQ